MFTVKNMSFVDIDDYKCVVFTFSYIVFKFIVILKKLT